MSYWAATSARGNCSIGRYTCASGINAVYPIIFSTIKIPVNRFPSSAQQYVYAIYLICRDRSFRRFSHFD